MMTDETYHRIGNEIDRLSVLHKDIEAFYTARDAYLDSLKSEGIDREVWLDEIERRMDARKPPVVERNPAYDGPMGVFDDFEG